MSEMPREIWLSEYNTVYTKPNHVVTMTPEMVLAKDSGLPKYHHDSVVQDLQRQNTDLQANNTKLVLENRLLRENSESQTQTNEALLKRIQAAMRHIEIVSPDGYQLSVVYNILNGGK